MAGTGECFHVAPGHSPIHTKTGTGDLASTAVPSRARDGHRQRNLPANHYASSVRIRALNLRGLRVAGKEVILAALRLYVERKADWPRGRSISNFLGVC